MRKTKYDMMIARWASARVSCHGRGYVNVRGFPITKRQTSAAAATQRQALAFLASNTHANRRLVAPVDSSSSPVRSPDTTGSTSPPPSRTSSARRCLSFLTTSARCFSAARLTCNETKVNTVAQKIENYGLERAWFVEPGVCFRAPVVAVRHLTNVRRSLDPATAYFKLLIRRTFARAPIIKPAAQRVFFITAAAHVRTPFLLLDWFMPTDSPFPHRKYHLLPRCSRPSAEAPASPAAPRGTGTPARRRGPRSPPPALAGRAAGA